MRRNARADAEERVRFCGHFAAHLRFAALAMKRTIPKGMWGIRRHIPLQVTPSNRRAQSTPKRSAISRPTTS